MKSIPTLILLALCRNVLSDFHESTNSQQIIPSSPEHVGLAHTQVIHNLQHHFERKLPQSSMEYLHAVSIEMRNISCEPNDPVCNSRIVRKTIEIQPGPQGEITDGLEYVKSILPTEFDPEVMSMIEDLYISSKFAQIKSPSKVLNFMNKRMEELKLSDKVSNDSHRMVGMLAYSVGMESLKQWAEIVGNPENPFNLITASDGKRKMKQARANNEVVAKEKKEDTEKGDKEVVEKEKKEDTEKGGKEVVEKEKKEENEKGNKEDDEKDNKEEDKKEPKDDDDDDDDDDERKEESDVDLEEAFLSTMQADITAAVESAFESVSFSLDESEIMKTAMEDASIASLKAFMMSFIEVPSLMDSECEFPNAFWCMDVGSVMGNDDDGPCLFPGSPLCNEDDLGGGSSGFLPESFNPCLIPNHPLCVSNNNNDGISGNNPEVGENEDCKFPNLPNCGQVNEVLNDPCVQFPNLPMCGGSDDDNQNDIFENLIVGVGTAPTPATVTGETTTTENGNQMNSGGTSSQSGTSNSSVINQASQSLCAIMPHLPACTIPNESANTNISEIEEEEINATETVIETIVEESDESDSGVIDDVEASLCEKFPDLPSCVEEGEVTQTTSGMEEDEEETLCEKFPTLPSCVTETVENETEANEPTEAEEGVTQESEANTATVNTVNVEQEVSDESETSVINEPVEEIDENNDSEAEATNGDESEINEIEENIEIIDEQQNDEVNIANPGNTQVHNSNVQENTNETESNADDFDGEIGLGETEVIDASDLVEDTICETFPNLPICEQDQTNVTSIEEGSIIGNHTNATTLVDEVGDNICERFPDLPICHVDGNITEVDVEEEEGDDGSSSDLFAEASSLSNLLGEATNVLNNGGNLNDVLSNAGLNLGAGAGSGSGSGSGSGTTGTTTGTKPCLFGICFP